MEGSSKIIKVWIRKGDNNTDKIVYALQDQFDLINEHKESFPALQKLHLEKAKRILLANHYAIRIALYYSADLDTRWFLNNKTNDFVFSQNNLESIDPNSEFSPIIHLFDDSEETRKVFFDDKYLQYHKDAPRFRAIVDSSIWNYFIMRDNDLNDIISKIYDNYEAHLYDLYIAREYADLNARIAKASYLYEYQLDENEKKGHASDVSPFLFHSEQKIKEKREEEYRSLNKVLNFKDYKWRILLVDDKIDKAYLQPDECEVSKDMIIKDCIEYLYGEKDSCECVFLHKDEEQKYNLQNVFDTINKKNPKVVILCVDNIEKAKVALKNYKFDFILLDYLLDRNDPKNKTEKRHYGYELLKDLDGIIDKDCSDLSPYLHYTDGGHYIVGPSRRYFFMFISAFTTAISERLRLEGFSRSEELWHIAEGACPTNTPELFCYNLQKMMIKRLKDSGIENLSPNKILHTVSYIYIREGGDDSTRKRANEQYQNILSLLYHYNRILEDVEIPTDGKDSWATQGSVLMTKYFINNLKEYGGLLEHLTHLVHLTAFGTARQWPEMWEEYLFFKNQFDSVCEDTDARKELYSAMEKYIIDLKKIN